MKRVFSVILLLGMIVSLSACGTGTITMQKVYDANRLDTLLKNHESVNVQHSLNGEVYGETYLSEEYTYDAAYGWAAFLTDRAYYACADGSYERVLLLTPDGLADLASYRAEYYTSVVLSPETVQETIRSVTKKDNRITVTSFLDQEKIKAFYTGEDGLNSCDCEYVLDAKTRELVSAKSVYGYGDGMVYEGVSDVVYDTEMPEGVKAFLNYERQTENLRTVTVVSNPGTKNEIKTSIQTPKGVPVGLSAAYDTDDAFELYADAACTQPHTTSGDYQSDATIYVKWVA